MEILLALVYTLVFSWIIFRWRFFSAKRLQKKFVLGVFLLKVIFGTILFYLYTYHYTDRSSADIYKYFDDSKVIYDALSDKPSDFFRMISGINDDAKELGHYYDKMNNWYRSSREKVYNDSRIMIRFNAVVRLFSFGHYHVHTVFMSFLSLIGLIAIYKAMENYFKNKEKWLMMCVFLVPSVLFWSSGPLKEGLLIFVFGLLIYTSFKLIRTKKIGRYGIVFLLCIWMMLYLKLYVLLSLIPGLVAFILVSKFRFKPLAVYGAVIILSFISIVLLRPVYDFFEVTSQKQTDFIRLVQGGVYAYNDDQKIIHVHNEDRAGIHYVDETHIQLLPEAQYYELDRSVKGKETFLLSTELDPSVFMIYLDKAPSKSRIELNQLNSNPLSFISAAPLALYNVLFRPLIIESKSALRVFSAIETLVFLLFSILALIFFKKPKRDQLNLILFLSSFVILLSLIIGWTTPIMGAIVRYKVPMLCFYLMLFLVLLDVNKLAKKIPALKLLN